MIYKSLFLTAIVTSLLFASVPKYSTTAVVTLIGAQVSSSDSNQVEKYKRKDCPVCKGKGWYISGDGIAKINCQYCEP